MLARSPRWLPWSLILCFALPAPVAARGLPHGGVGQEGAHVPGSGVPEMAVGSRFAPMQILGGSPDLSLRVGAWSEGSLGVDYARSGMLPGNPHELEFSLKQALMSEKRGHPLSASLMGAVNTGAYSLDGELALSRRLGPLTMLGTVRLLGNAEGARTPLGGMGMGAELAVSPGISLIGDVFRVTGRADAKPAWGAGVRMHLPQTPYTATVYLANTASATRQGASFGAPDLRLGVGLGLAFGGNSEASKAPDVSLRQQPGSAATEPGGSTAPTGGALPAQVVPARATSPAETDGAAFAAGYETTRAQAAKAKSPATQSPKAQDAKAAVAPAPAKATRPFAKAAEKRPLRSKARAPKQATPAPRVAAQAPRAHELWIVMIRDGQATPRQIQLAKGSSVTWFNRDAKPHAWTASGWETGVVEPGKQITRRFDRAGTYVYRCRLHPREGGTVTVR